MDAGDAAAADHVQHVALTEQVFGPLLARIVRLSILDVTWKEMRVGKFALIVPVMTSTEGRWVAMIRWMPAARASVPGAGSPLRSPCRPHHQVGHLVDDDDDIGHGREIERLLLIDRLAGRAVEAGLHIGIDRLALRPCSGRPAVIAVDVAHAEARHLAIALLHFAHAHFIQRMTAFFGSVTTGSGDAGCRRRSTAPASSDRP